MGSPVPGWPATCYAAIETFKEVLKTPYMQSIEFTFRAEMEAPPKVEYTITRAIVPKKIKDIPEETE